jgi:hypothetical protein
VLKVFVVDREPDDRGVIVTVTMVGHCDDASIQLGARRGDRLLQMIRECRDPASTRE